MSHILLNYTFLLFLSILGEIHKDLFILVIKVTISDTSTEILRNVFFIPCLKGANTEENLNLFKQLFLIKPVKGININKNFFSPQSEPHTAKLCLSVVLKHFW